MNQRQIDVTFREAFPLLASTLPEAIGVVAPYNGHVDALARQLGNDSIKVHTIHKFQDREKDTLLARCGIPLPRFATNGSVEIEQVRHALGL